MFMEKKNENTQIGSENIKFSVGKPKLLRIRDVIIKIPVVLVYYEKCGHIHIGTGSILSLKTYFSKWIIF